MVSIFLAARTSAAEAGRGIIQRLVPDDAKALREVPEVEYVSEGLQTRQQVIYGSQNWSTNVVGVNKDYTSIKSWPMKYGSFFTEADVQAAAKVCTLGINVAENLFGQDVDPTGVEIRVRSQIFHVLGVMGPKGSSSSGQNQDDQILAV
jgi:putative ABC transport system permease protein